MSAELTVRTDELRLGLTEPVFTARGPIFERVGTVLVIADAAGHWGRGELAPLPGWSATDLLTASAELDAWVGAVRNGAPPAVPATGSPEVRAAIDAALVTLEAAVSDQPLWRFLGGATGEVAVNALVVGGTATAVADAAVAAIAEGYSTVKVKLGVGDDRERIDALASSVPSGSRVRLDANAAWDDATAEALLAHAAGALGDRLEYVEDPAADLATCLSLAAHGVAPIAVDETVRATSDAAAVAEAGSVAAVVVKPPLLGGIRPVLDLARPLAEAGVDVVVSSLYDGPVGLAAWCHLAAALGGRRAHGLGTAALFSGSAAAHLRPRGGVITL